MVQILFRVHVSSTIRAVRIVIVVVEVVVGRIRSSVSAESAVEVRRISTEVGPYVRPKPRPDRPTYTSTKGPDLVHDNLVVLLGKCPGKTVVRSDVSKVGQVDLRKLKHQACAKS